MTSSGLVYALVLFTFLIARCGGQQAFAPPRICRRNSDCKDGLKCTMDYCNLGRNTCFNVPFVRNIGITSCSTPSVRRTRRSIISEVNAVQLSVAEQVEILEYVILVQRDLHPHRVLHLKFLKIDIIPELIALLARVRDTTKPRMKNLQFHNAIIRIISKVQDGHNIYVTPPPLRQVISFLPFTLAEFYTASSPNPRFTISETIRGAIPWKTRVTFRPGVEILEWNGKPILSAVLEAGELGVGGNAASKLARGVQDLTNRRSGLQLFPEPGPFVVKYKDLCGTIRTAKFYWIHFTVPLNVANFVAVVPELPAAPQPTPSNVPTAARMSKPCSRFARLRARSKTRYGLRVPLCRKRAIPSSEITRTNVPVQKPLGSSMFAEVVKVKVGASMESIGVLKIINFGVQGNENAWFAELKRILFTQLPQTGVIIDVRNNPGGSQTACQRIAQLFTSNIVRSVGGVFRLTQLTSPFAQNQPNTSPLNTAEGFQALLDTNKIKVQIGDQFSAFQDNNLTLLINSDQGPNYSGPVIVLTSATTFSCAEVMTSNFIDTQPKIGRVIGVHNATAGGGGAQLNSVFLSRIGIPLPPAGAFARFTGIRLERVGFKIDSTWEFFGLKPDKVYRPTKADAIDEVDLFKYLANELNSMK